MSQNWPSAELTRVSAAVWRVVTATSAAADNEVAIATRRTRIVDPNSTRTALRVITGIETLQSRRDPRRAAAHRHLGMPPRRRGALRRRAQARRIPDRGARTVRRVGQGVPGSRDRDGHTARADP